MLAECIAKDLLSPKSACALRHSTWTLITIWLPWEKSHLLLSSFSQAAAAGGYTMTSRVFKGMSVPSEGECHTHAPSEDFTGSTSGCREACNPSRCGPQSDPCWTQEETDTDGVPSLLSSPVKWWHAHGPQALYKRICAESQSRSPNEKSPTLEKKLAPGYALASYGMLS